MLKKIVGAIFGIAGVGMIVLLPGSNPDGKTLLLGTAWMLGGIGLVLVGTWLFGILKLEKNMNAQEKLENRLFSGIMIVSLGALYFPWAIINGYGAFDMTYPYFASFALIIIGAVIVKSYYKKQ